MIKKFAFIFLVFSLGWGALALADEPLLLKIEITGLPKPLLENAQAQLAIQQESSGKKPTIDKIYHFFEQSPDIIKKAIQPFGYFKPQIHPTLQQKGNQWIAHFEVNPGPRLHINQVKLTIVGPGKENAALQTFIRHFPLFAGQLFETNSYEKAKQDLFQLANNQGYIKTILEKKEVYINLKEYYVNITIQLNTGPRYYFGPISFNKSPFADSFLQRFVFFHPGDPFSSQKLLRLQQNLRNSQYFSQVTVNPRLKQADHYQVPIHIHLGIPKSQQYSAGIGYGTLTGPRFTLGTHLRRIGSHGQHFDLQMKLSAVITGLAANYYIPGKNPATQQYVIGANFLRFASHRNESFSHTFSVGYRKKAKTWRIISNLNYLTERFVISPNPTHTSQMVYPSINIERVKTDNPVDARWGNAINISLQGASKNLLSRTNFAQSEIKGKLIFSPTEKSRFILRGDAGYTVVNNLDTLPLTLQFLAGGMNSIRGYSYGDIGPGRYLRVGSIEYQHQIKGSWRGAVFYDLGTASNNFTAPLSKGEGVGVIYNSLIGNIQLYVARAVSIPHQPWRIEFSIGPDF